VSEARHVSETSRASVIILIKNEFLMHLYVYKYFKMTSRARELESAIYENNIQALKDLLRSGVDPNTVLYPGGDTALMIVARDSCSKYGNRDEKMIHILIEAGANPNIQNVSGETALMMAVENYEDKTIYTEDVEDLPMYFSSASAIKTLITAGADTFIKNEEGQDVYDVATTNALEILKSVDKRRNLFNMICLLKIIS